MVKTTELDLLIVLSQDSVVRALNACREKGVTAKVFPVPHSRSRNRSIDFALAIPSESLKECELVLKQLQIDLLSLERCDNPVRAFYENSGN